jgi:hypothetical protein
MDNKKVLFSHNVTPTTKRIGIICLTVLAAVSVIGACFGKISFENAALIALPAMTSISAMIDGGK